MDELERELDRYDTAARLAVEGRTPCGNLPANDNVPVAWQQARGFVYLGSPYSKQPDLEDAAALAERAAARLMEAGLVVYSPIAHGHAIAQHGLPVTWNFWKAQCQPFIDAAEFLIVLMLDGWEDSVGLTYEIEEFERQGKRVTYVTLEELEAEEEQPEYPEADREASRADWLIRARKEGVA